MREQWSDAVLGILRDMPGKPWHLHEIYDEMMRNPLVTPYHLEPWRPGLQPRYQCWTRRVLTDLVRSQQVRRIKKAVYTAP